MISRRQIIQWSSGAIALGSLPVRGAVTATEGTPGSPTAPQLITRPIPSTGEQLPVIGMGTSRTFDTGGDAESLANLAAVLGAFSAGGGTVIDSSPMYGKAESRVGELLRSAEPKAKVFAATKVWTEGQAEGIAQMEESARRMHVERFDLIAVHNLVDWQTQLATLKEWKAQGKVRYIGITTSHGRDHDALLQVMREEPLDFVQFSYNIEDRKAEQRILPLAQDKGIATMINRPFQRGSLFKSVQGKALPDFAKDFGCTSWGQFFLKFILGHPAVTCIIPATSKVQHMQDNMQANFGRVPDTADRIRMLRYLYKSF